MTPKKFQYVVYGLLK